MEENGLNQRKLVKAKKMSEIKESVEENELNKRK